MYRNSTSLLCSCLAAGLLLLAGAGCATHTDRLQGVRNQFFTGNLTAAQAEAVELQQKHKNEADVLMLDQAMIKLASGEPKEAERLLRTVRDRFDHLDQLSVAEEAKSLLTDDNARAYNGEDYEKVLIRAMLSLSNLMSTGDDAGAFALQITEKQQEIAKRRESLDADAQAKAQAYQQVALGPYIRAMLAEQSPLTLDDAVRARVQVAEYAPQFPSGQADIARAQHEVPIPSGHGVLYVFTLVGRGPVKEEEAAIATQAALLIADRIVSAIAPRDLPPTIAPVKIPKVRTIYSPVSGVDVNIDGKSLGQTATIVDVGKMATLQQEALESEIIGRAVARRVLKKGIVYAAKDAMSLEPTGAGNLLMDVGGVIWEATEQADLRCWGLLPDRIQVLRVALPAGDHQLTLRTSPSGMPTQKTIRVPEGRNIYVLGQFPDQHLVGELLVNAP